MAELPYHEQVNIENTEKLRELLKPLPPYVKTYFRGIETQTSSKTRIAYAYDLHIFFEFLQKENPVLQKLEIKDITLSHLEQLKPLDISDYMEYIKYYHSTADHVNGERGQKRKLASLKSFYNFLYKNEMISNNPAALVDLPKLHEKNIVRLDVDEVAILLDEVEQGDKLSKKQQAYHAKTKVRDLAIMTLLLGTGIRVSECVGLNIQDVDFRNSGIKIYRKGGKEMIVYFGEEVEAALSDYLKERKHVIAEKGSTDALFLSLQKKRMSVRSVENLVKKYSRTVTTLKNITPHKLRSTYGTNLYQETNDIYLVADVLGHSDVNTTRKHYAALDDYQRRRARTAVRLRENIEIDSQDPKDENP